MNKKYLVGFLFLVFLFTFTSLIFSQTKTTEFVISPGVIYKKIISPADTLTIHILKADLSLANYSLKTIKADNLLNAKETTSEMVNSFSENGENIIAAINGDFFESDGEVIGNMISGGNFVKAVKFSESPYNSYTNSQFALTDKNRLLIEQFVFTAHLILPNGTIEEIKRINSAADSNSISLYNSFQGMQTPNSPAGWTTFETSIYFLEQIGDTLFYKVSNPFTRDGNTKITGNDFILSSNNKYAFYLESNISIGDTLRLLLKFNPRFSGISNLIGGWPRLIKDGKNIIKTNKNAEGVIERFSENRHPRSAVGFDKDSTTIFFIAVDGRQKSSRGMTLEELADFMIGEGLYQGLNLDGGGSTTMVINNVVVNQPSDASGEREVGNCLVLIRKE